MENQNKNPETDKFAAAVQLFIVLPLSIYSLVMALGAL